LKTRFFHCNAGTSVRYASSGRKALSRPGTDARGTALRGTAGEDGEHRLQTTEARWRAAFVQAPVAMAEVALDGTLLRGNPALARLAGRPWEELAGTSCLDLVHTEDRAAVGKDLSVIRAGKQGAPRPERRVVRPDGAVAWVAVHKSVLRFGRGDEDRVLVHLVDITAERARREAVQEASDRLTALIEHGCDSIVVFDRHLVLRYASPAAGRLFGTSPEQLLGTPLALRAHPDDLDQITKDLTALAAQPGGVISYEARLRCADGTWRTLDVTASNQLDNPLINGLVCSGRDVTERVEEAVRLAHLATHDALTALANRALFMDQLTRALARTERSGGSCALLLLDIDKFKLVNDNLGHAAGDEFLVIAAERLQAAVRPGDTVARLGGDEFAILAEDIRDDSVAVDIAERARRTLSRPFVVQGRDITLGCSIGIAMSERHRPEVLLQEADMALYRAKGAGRDRWELYDQHMRTDTRRRLETQETLRSALQMDTVTVLYQPIVDLVTGCTTGTEALARLRGPGGRLVRPSSFIEVAEDSGLIVPLGTTVLDQACAQQAEWGRQAPESYQRVWVNISGRQLASRSLVDQVAETLAMRRLGPEHLCLELTEPAILDSGPITRRSVEDLKALGVALALDDFGTGYSSLAHLRHFPFDIIKVDRSFVAGVGRNDDDTEVVRAVISLGHALRLTTVAEGIETLEQATYLRQLGCDYGQGYLFGRPVLPDHLAPQQCDLFRRPC
jgi:diguanylate cyclase (GGDEF)-like protein/PAS domain S-box-containing protein